MSRKPFHDKLDISGQIPEPHTFQALMQINPSAAQADSILFNINAASAGRQSAVGDLYELSQTWIILSVNDPRRPQHPLTGLKLAHQLRHDLLLSLGARV